MPLPRKAFILAAGLGTRLRPLTLETPKPMLPLWNRPMLDRALERMAQWGVREVLINLHHAPGPIVNYLATIPFPELRICATFEPEILGTGGALLKAAWFLDEPFWLLNADVVMDVDPRPLLRAKAKHRALASCWLTDTAGPRTVRCERGRIRSFHDPENGTDTFCGLQLLDPRILRFIKPEGFDTIIAAYQRAQAKGHRIAGVRIPGSFWADIGLPDQYVQAHRDTARLLGHEGESFTLPAAAVLTKREQKLITSSSPHLDIEDWILDIGNCPFLPVEVLPPRGSAREFFRIRHGKQSDILIRWSPERPENRLYARHTRFLETLGIPVPRLRLDAARDRLLAIEDLGPDSLQSRLGSLGLAARERLYRRILRIFLRLHQEGLPAARRKRLPLMPGFNEALYRWEHDYFIDQMLLKRLRWPESKICAIRQELQSAAVGLKQSPQGLIHRDAQSSNILFRGTAPVLIDIQGMRRGPVAYDLASLLCDPYVNLSAELQQSLLRFYARRHPQGDAIRAVFPAAAIQRLCQALGAYAVLSRKPGMESFARHIRPAARQLLRALKGQKYPALRAAARDLSRNS